VTPKGFTQHEHLNQLELIHMNGRAYDYHLGRFTGVDPFIQFPLNSQSLNPYSYILNNPLSGTDPTGYAACTGSHIENSGGADCPTTTGARIDGPMEFAPGKKSGRQTLDSSSRNNASNDAPIIESIIVPVPSNATRFIGGLKVIGGGIECAGGALLCTTGIGCAASVLMCAHAADTMTSGAHEVWYGTPQQSLTSKGLEAAGLTREQADFGDSVIGLTNVGAAGAKATWTVATIRGASSVDDMARVASIRESLGVGAGKNIAFADYEIGGVSGALTSVSGKHQFAGTVPNPTNLLFNYIATGNNPRMLDSESKIFEHLAASLPRDAVGRVRIFSERPLCVSCSGVAKQFQQMFPGIKITTASGAGR
jgi:RHS repeat-associated protein